VLVYRYAPVRSRVPRSRRACPVTSAGPADAWPALSALPPQLRDDATRREARPACARRACAASARNRSYTISQSKRYYR
jgi:hypothetical protein